MTMHVGDNETVEIRASRGGTAFMWRPGDDGAEDVEVAHWDAAAELLTIFPRSSMLGQLESQFSSIARLEIAVEALASRDPEQSVAENDRGNGLELQCLPDGFGRIFRYGLGLRRRYRGVVERVEEHTNCTAVRFSATGPEGPDGRVFRMHLARFEAFRRAVDLNQSRATMIAGRVNATQAHNTVAEVLGLAPKVTTVGRHPVIVAMTRELTGRPALDSEERRSLVRQASRESRATAEESPEHFGQLRKDIELVTLDVLIDQFDKSMAGVAAKDESHWQEFFERNTFALQQLFAAPIALYGSQMTVRGVNAFGEGSRIADFILVNTVLRTALVVEIKTPAAGLAGPVYRGKGGAEVHLPHRDLLGAIAQVQSQMESVRTDLPNLLGNTPGAKGLDTYHVRGAVIAGTARALTPEAKASYLRYRNGLGEVDVIAFDEVRERLAVLRDLLGDVEPLV